MAFNTGNPIGSTDARDLSDNAENMDILENSTTLNEHPDRLGVMRKTRKGMELEHDNQIAAHEAEHDAQISAHELEHDNQMQSFENDFDSRLAGMAFTRVGTFTDGATLTDVRQTLLWEVSQGGDGFEYSWLGSFPKVVQAMSRPIPVADENWVCRTQDSLSVLLSSPYGADFIRTRSGKSVQMEIDNMPSIVSAEADRAENAADAASLSGSVYESTVLGLASTASGGYFNVISASSVNYIDLYKNESGIAVFVKSYPSTEAINSIEGAFNKNLVNDALEIQAANGDVLARFDASGLHTPVASSTELNIEDDDGLQSATLSPDDNLHDILIEAKDGAEIARFGRDGVGIKNARIESIRSSTDRKFSTDGSLVPAAIASASRGMRAVNHILLLGRSLAAGRGILRYTEPLYNSLSVTGVNSIAGVTDPCVEFNTAIVSNSTSFTEGPLGTEKFTHFAVDHCLQLLGRHKNIDPGNCEPRFLTSVFAIGDKTIASLSQKTLPHLQNHIDSTKKLVESSGHSYNFAGIMMCHAEGVNEELEAGETVLNGVTYKAAIKSYLDTIKGYVETVTGRHKRSIPVFIITQPNSANFGSLELEGNISYYLLSKEDEKFFYSSTTNMCEGATADHPESPDNLHKSGYGTLSAAANTGRCMYRYFFGNGDGSGLRPISVTAINNVILLKLNKSGLYFRSSTHNGTSYFTVGDNHGFTVSNKEIGLRSDETVSNELVISSITLIGDTVKIKTTENIPEGYKLYCNVSDISSNYDHDLYAAQATDGTQFDPFDTLIDFAEEVIIYG